MNLQEIAKFNEQFKNQILTTAKKDSEAARSLFSHSANHKVSADNPKKHLGDNALRHSPTLQSECLKKRTDHQ